MICSNCGRGIPDRSKFCPHCGCTVVRQPAPASAPPSAPAPAPEKRGRKTLWITLGAVGLVILLAVAALLVFKILPDGQAPSADPTLPPAGTAESGGATAETETRLAEPETKPYTEPTQTADPPDPTDASGEDAALLFLGNIEALEETYGAVRAVESDALGLCWVQVVDFDRDGKDELYTVCNAVSADGTAVPVTAVFAIHGNRSEQIFTYEGVMFLSEREDRAMLGAVLEGAGEKDLDYYMEFYAYNGSEFRYDSDFGVKYGDWTEDEPSTYYRNGQVCDLETYLEGACDVNGEYNTMYLGSYREGLLRYQVELVTDQLRTAAGLPSGRDTYAGIVDAILRCSEYGGGMLLDIDGDGTEELLLSYDLSGMETWCAVYTQKNGRAVPLLPEGKAVILAGSPYGCVGVVTVDGRRCCFREGQLNSTDIVGGINTENWLLIPLDEPAAEIRVKYRREYESMDMDEYIERVEAGEDVQLGYTETVVYNDKPMSAEDYTAWKAGMVFDVKIDSHWPEDLDGYRDLYELAALLRAS